MQQPLYGNSSGNLFATMVTCMALAETSATFYNVNYGSTRQHRYCDTLNPCYNPERTPPGNLTEILYGTTEETLEGTVHEHSN